MLKKLRIRTFFDLDCYYNKTILLIKLQLLWTTEENTLAQKR